MAGLEAVDGRSYTVHFWRVSCLSGCFMGYALHRGLDGHRECVLLLHAMVGSFLTVLDVVRLCRGVKGASKHYSYMLRPRWS